MSSAEDPAVRLLNRTLASSLLYAVLKLLFFFLSKATSILGIFLGILNKCLNALISQVLIFSDIALFTFHNTG